MMVLPANDTLPLTLANPSLGHHPSKVEAFRSCMRDL